VQHLERGTALVSQYIEIGNIVGYASLAMVEQARGNEKQADSIIDKARQIAIEFDATEMDDALVDITQVRVLLARGDVSGAARCVENWHLDEADPSMFDLREIQQLTRARLYIAQERTEKALATLEPLLLSAERLGRVRRMIETLALRATALHVGGDSDQALTILARALELGEKAGFVRTFVDIGRPMTSLLHEAASRGLSPEYVGRLLAAFDAPGISADRTQPLIEPLSERELEVLGCLAEGLSNREIAHKLHISLPTVKSHTRNIYGKLDVHNRKQAVSRAETLGILPPPASGRT